MQLLKQHEKSCFENEIDVKYLHIDEKRFSVIKGLLELFSNEICQRVFMTLNLKVFPFFQGFYVTA